MLKINYIFNLIPVDNISREMNEMVILPYDLNNQTPVRNRQEEQHSSQSSSMHYDSASQQPYNQPSIDQSIDDETPIVINDGSFNYGKKAKWRARTDSINFEEEQKLDEP